MMMMMMMMMMMVMIFFDDFSMTSLLNLEKCSCAHAATASAQAALRCSELAP